MNWIRKKHKTGTDVRITDVLLKDCKRKKDIDLSREIGYNNIILKNVLPDRAVKEKSMPHINLLSPHVADLIAAGEVVERPASVIKELMENAFDAGAKNVVVEITNGGATMIRVTDDGCGMAPEDAGIAFLRHATSKLKDETGLEAIETMGFRGEALAAISAVSQIELCTRRAEDAEGTLMTLTAGDIDEMEPIGCPAGTSICIRDLFFNTPARLKFLKSDRSEASACLLAGLRCALGRPEVSVRFLRDGKEEFFTPGDGDTAACCYALLGRELSSTLLPVYSEDSGVRLSGFVSSPAAGRGNRSAQYFFVNGRFIRSSLLQAALEQAYRNTLLTGRYPACVIYLEIRPGAVDVNVHPAKIEVKFSEERRIFNILYQAAQETLRGENRVLPDRKEEERTRPTTAETADKASAQMPAGDEIQSVNAAFTTPMQILEQQNAGSPSARTFRPTDKAGEAAFPAIVGSTTDAAVFPQESLFASPVAEYSREADIQTAVHKEAEESPEASRMTAQNSAVPAAVPFEKTVPVSDSADMPAYKIIGEALKTYIIVEMEDRIILIDKHAAHERMNFDRLKSRQQPAAAQQLLIPQTKRVTPEEAGLLGEYRELFADFGFEIESFGEDTVILRGVPAEILPEDAVPALEEILAHLQEGGTPDPSAARDELLHTVACKAAIKAGWNTGIQEMNKIADEVLSGRIKYCPHGRPVSATVTRRDLDKLFLRIV